MGPDAFILVFWMLSFKPAFLLSSFTFIKRLPSIHFRKEKKKKKEETLEKTKKWTENPREQPISTKWPQCEVK